MLVSGWRAKELIQTKTKKKIKIKLGKCAAWTHSACAMMTTADKTKETKKMEFFLFMNQNTIKQKEKALVAPH